MEGYIDRVSCRPGDLVRLHVSTWARMYDVEVFREGATSEFVARVEGIPGGHHPVPVEAYADGEAFMRAGTPPPDDMIFVDLGLPGVGGQHVIKWLNTLAQPPRVVAISGRSRGDIEAALRDLPNLTLLRKPLAAEAITPYLQEQGA